MECRPRGVVKESVGSVVANLLVAVEEVVDERQEEKEEILDAVVAAGAAAGEEWLMGVDDVGRSERREARGNAEAQEGDEDVEEEEGEDEHLLGMVMGAKPDVMTTQALGMNEANDRSIRTAETNENNKPTPKMEADCIDSRRKGKGIVYGRGELLTLSKEARDGVTAGEVAS